MRTNFRNINTFVNYLTNYHWFIASLILRDDPPYLFCSAIHDDSTTPTRIVPVAFIPPRNKKYIGTIVSIQGTLYLVNTAQVQCSRWFPPDQLAIQLEKI